VLLDEREITDAPSLPRLNAMRVVAATAVSGEFSWLNTSIAQQFGRPTGHLLSVLRGQMSCGAARVEELNSRLPRWDDSKQLLTLDYPPGRASIASVQNFQLAPQVQSAPISTQPGSSSSRRARGSRASLVHGLLVTSPEMDTFSLDFRAPLSPLIAFAACLAAQDWQ